MKHLISFLFGIFFLFSMAGRAFASTGNDLQNLGSHPVSVKNIHTSHHHKTHKVSSIDLTDDDDSQSLQSSWMAAIAVVVVFLPKFLTFFFAGKSVDFSRFEVFFKPNLRRHLLLRRITV